MITLPDGESQFVREPEWKTTVLQFSSMVRNFYDSSTPKELFDDDERRGFEKMMSEWNRRHPRSP
jgi:hypothetical protein